MNSKNDGQKNILSKKKFWHIFRFRIMHYVVCAFLQACPEHYLSPSTSCRDTINILRFKKGVSLFIVFGIYFHIHCVCYTLRNFQKMWVKIQKFILSQHFSRIKNVQSNPNTNLEGQVSNPKKHDQNTCLLLWRSVWVTL